MRAILIVALWLLASAAHAQIFTPEGMTPAAVCDNSTDNTAAFQALGAAIQAAQGGVVEMAPGGCTYRVFPNPPAGASGLIMLSGLKSLTVNCHGATLATPYSFPNEGTALYFWQFSQSRNITFNDCRFEQIGYNVRDNTRGVHPLTFTDGIYNVAINNLTTQATISAVLCSRAPTAERSSNFRITNLKGTNTYYGINGAKCPDNLTATGVTMANPGRSYFVYNVWNHNVQILSNANTGPQDVLIGNSYDAADIDPQGNFTKGITVKYENSNWPGGNNGGTGVNAFTQIQFGTFGTSVEGPAEIEGVDITANVHRPDSGSPGPLLRITRGEVTTHQNRKLSNVTLRGGHQTNATSPVVLDLMTDSDWSGSNADVVSNLTIENLVCNGYGSPLVRIDGRALSGPFVMRNVWGNGVCGYTGTNMTGPVAAGRVNFNQVWLPTLTTP